MAVMAYQAPLAGAQPLVETPLVEPAPAAAEARREVPADYAGDRVAFRVWKVGIVMMAAMLLWNLLGALAGF